MPTTSIIVFESPDGGDQAIVRVHYDGDAVGLGLGEIIARDGYAKAFETLAGSESRLWREITPECGSALPEYVSRFPQNLPVSAPVEGYGVLFVNEAALSKADADRLDPAQTGDRQYHVTAQGTVQEIR